MQWERNPFYRGDKCLVCGERARGFVAPFGIVSGSIPCHSSHSDREIQDAYMQWCKTSWLAVQGQLEER